MGDTDQARRRWLKRLTVAIGGAIGAVVTYPLVRYLFYPVGRRVVTSAGGPVDVGPAAALLAGAPPSRVSINAASVRDAWSLSGEVPLGAAWLSRTDAGELVAFSATCPHLGCAVDFDAAAGQFRCPCHKSAFSPAGDKVGGPAKRGLDPLPVEEKDGRVLVTFVKFRSDVPDREPV